MIKKALYLGLCIAFSAFVAVHEDVYKVNVEKSSLQWTGKKLTGEHNGTVQFTQGELKHNHGNWSGRLEADMTTIECTDLTGNSKKNMEGHLKSADFFDATTYPKATFEIISITPLASPAEDGSTHLVKGKFTIKDKMNEEQFNVALKDAGNGALSCTGTAVIDRSKYNVRYGSKTFFADIGGKIIYDEFTLKFNVLLSK